MIITSGTSRLKFNSEGKIISFATQNRESYKGLAPFKICVAGESEGQFSELTAANCLLSEQFSLSDCYQRNGGAVFVYRHERLRLCAEIEILPLGGTGVFYTRAGLINEGENAVVVNRFSSAFAAGFGGKISEKAPNYRVHVFESAWHAEARHREYTLSELGLTYVSSHFMSKSFTLVSEGGYTTAKFFPALYLQDRRKKRVWFMTSECNGGWRMQLGHAAEYASQNAGWYMESCALSASDLGTYRTLGKNERYDAPPALFGSVKGGLDEATEALTRARRALYKRETPPLMFNDYMNCLWSDVHEKEVLALADKAALVGAEGYCIDSGWFLPVNDMRGRLGDWSESRERFPERGLRGTIDYIRGKGLIAGIWTELEICSDNAEAFSLPDSYFILFEGKRAGGGERFFFDMRNPEVCAFLTEKVRKLYDLGIRYIKNDFNAALRWITDANTIFENHRAAMNFYESLKAKFPDLYLENCGSGAMRSDYGTLKYFCTQSMSDQEIYYFNPPVLQGMFANILPEQAGVWAYPYPNLFEVRADKKALEEEAARQSDGRQTIFNMVNGLAGNLYLSGRLDCADRENLCLIGEGAALFKALRPFKERASAVYPNGFADISDLGEFTTLGLVDYEKTRMYLYFWRFNGKKSSFAVPLKKWLGAGAEIRRVYPEKDYGVRARLNGNFAEITADVPLSAAVFEIVLKGEL